jgi:hypothetical protein
MPWANTVSDVITLNCEDKEEWQKCRWNGKVIGQVRDILFWGGEIPRLPSSSFWYEKYDNEDVRIVEIVVSEGDRGILIF